MSVFRSFVIMSLAVLAAAALAACSSAPLRESAHSPGAAASPRDSSAADVGAPVIPVPATLAFYSDGCSGFREARFFSCCYVHDLTFWAGGNRADRRRADLTLRQCLLDISHNRIVADFGYFLVTLGTVAGEVVGVGWGRAWRGTDHGRYDRLSPGQKLTVAAERQKICDGLRLNPKTGRYRVDDAPDLWREVWPAQARQICGR